MTPAPKNIHPASKPPEQKFDPKDFPEETAKYLKQHASKEEILVRAIYEGKSESAKKVRFIQMKFALNKKLLQHAEFSVSDPNFEKLLEQYAEKEGIDIKKINRDHIRK